MKTYTRPHGFTAIETILLLVILAIIGLLGWYMFGLQTNARQDSSTAKTSQKDSDKPQTPQEKNAAAEKQYNSTYQDWKLIHSQFGGFYLRHPSSWNIKWIYDQNDDGRVERIKIMSDNLVVFIDTFDGIPKTNSETTGAKCGDCVEVLSRKSLNDTQITALEIQRVRYKLEDGQANALILRKKDGTYVLAHSSNSSYLTTFRATSILDSNDAYKAEPAEDFAKNPDLGQASYLFQTLFYEPF